MIRTNDIVTEAWQAAYDYKRHTEQPVVVTVPAGYWLAALPAVFMCILLVVAFPGG